MIPPQAAKLQVLSLGDSEMARRSETQRDRDRPGAYIHTLRCILLTFSRHRLSSCVISLR